MLGPARRRLMITGASARAAAFSALRGGFEPVTIDLFADQDLSTCCDAHRVEHYPHGIATIAQRLPPCDWLYVGGLENHPSLVDQLAQRARLWGNSGRVLRRVRNPLLMTATLKGAGLPVAEARQTKSPTEGDWLLKPLKSSGGSHIRHVRPREDCADAAEHFLQRFIDGTSYSAVYVANGQSASLLGITRQLVGPPWTVEFRYAGSIGPIRLPDKLEDQFMRIGETLTRAFDLTGLFGVDAIVADAVWPVEVNPRYPASAEVLERAGKFSAVARHLASYSGQLPTSAPLASDQLVGKLIVYAKTSVSIEDVFFAYVSSVNQASVPVIADIPQPNSIIPQGRPVTTVFASGETIGEVVSQLARRRNEVQSLLRP